HVALPPAGLRPAFEQSLSQTAESLCEKGDGTPYNHGSRPLSRTGRGGPRRAAEGQFTQVLGRKLLPEQFAPFLRVRPNPRWHGGPVAGSARLHAAGYNRRRR